MTFCRHNEDAGSLESSPVGAPLQLSGRSANFEAGDDKITYQLAPHSNSCAFRAAAGGAKEAQCLVVVFRPSDGLRFWRCA